MPSPAPSAARRALAAPLACALLAALDAASAGPAVAAYAAGLGVALGALGGLAWAGLGSTLTRLPRPLALLPWLAPGALLGWWLIEALGARARLGGPHHDLAVFALLAAAGLTVALGALLAGLQPVAGAPDGLLARGRGRVALLVALPVLALAAAWIDRTRFVGLYPAAHTALRLLTLGAAVAAAGLVRRRPLPRPARVALLALAAGLAGLPFFALHRDADRPLGALAARPLPGLMLDAARALTDVDRDGASALLGGGDRDAFAAPAEPPAVPPAPGAAVPPTPTGPAPTSVVLITIDTLRPDRMSLHGHPRRTTPAIDAFAEGALVFERAVTPGGWTSLAISSLMRGVAPRRLRWTKVVETSDYRLTKWRDRATLDRRLRLRMMFGLPLDDPHPPLAARLADRGMHTVAVVDDGYSQFLSAGLGAGQGFADFRSVDDLPKPRRTDRGTTDLALAALDARPPEQRFFLWVHYFGPHDPTRRHPDAEWYGAGVADGYDHEVAYADRQVGRLLERLDAIAAAEPLAVVLTSDHGEAFYARRRMHGLGLQPAVLRIPLIVRAPGVAPGRSPAPATLLDVHPTLLALTDTPPGPGLDGMDLRRLPPDRVVTADTWRYDRDGEPVWDKAAATDGRHVLRLDRVRNLRAVWAMDDLSHAPDDLTGLVDAAHLEAALGRYLDATGGGRVILVE